MRVALIGGTGFTGRYFVEALLRAGVEPSLLVRPGSEHKVVRASACRLITGSLTSTDSIRATLQGCDAAIFNVGILREDRRNGITFEALQYDAAARTIDAMRASGVRRLLLMSANGVKEPGTAYQVSKYRAERYAFDSGLDVTVFRPSVIFGNPQGAMEFATQLCRDMVRPPLPAVGFFNGLFPSRGRVTMSPVHVEDVADAFVGALSNDETIGRTYALGGPEILDWTEMLRRIAAACGRKKRILPMPIAVMQIAALLLDWIPAFPVTRDQLTMLAEGNEADPAVLEMLIGRHPTPFSTAALSYLAAAG